MSAGYEWRKIRHVTTEWAILIWLAIGAGIAGGVFLVARSAVQIGSVAYRVMEKELSREAATRQTALLSLAIIAALAVTAVIAGKGSLAAFGQSPETAGAITPPTNGPCQPNTPDLTRPHGSSP